MPVPFLISTDAVPPLARTAFDGLTKGGTPAALLKVAEAYFSERASILAEQWRPAREGPALDALADRTLARLRGVAAELEHVAREERDAEWARADTAGAAGLALPAAKLGESDTRHANDLAKVSAARLQALAEITIASTDVMLALATSDVSTLVELFDAALDSPAQHPDRVRAVGRAVSGRLFDLAVLEARSATGATVATYRGGRCRGPVGALEGAHGGPVSGGPSRRGWANL